MTPSKINPTVTKTENSEEESPKQETQKYDYKNNQLNERGYV
jgi:hypothetical protein